MNGGLTLFEEFFYVVFGTDVPAYQEFSMGDRINLDEQSKNLMGNMSNLGRPTPEEREEIKKLMKDKQELSEVKPFLDVMYKIVDGEWTAKYLNIQQTKPLIYTNSYMTFQTAQEWWDFVKAKDVMTHSIVRDRSSKLWIWSFGGVSLMVEGQDAYIITDTEMQNQIYLNMLGTNIVCYLTVNPPINFLGRTEFLWRFLKSTTSQ